jgi:hypothetical protein
MPLLTENIVVKIIIPFTLISLVFISCNSSKNDESKTEFSIVLKGSENGLVNPFQDINSLDSSYILSETLFPLPEVFEKYKDTSQYSLYELQSSQFNEVYENSEGDIIAYIYLLVEDKSKKVVGVLGHWGVYPEIDSTNREKIARMIENDFSSRIDGKIRLKKGWRHTINHEEYRECLQFYPSELFEGNEMLPRIQYKVEF